MAMTRAWGPPFLKDADGENTSEAAYYLSANRNKQSVTIDFTRPEGKSWCVSWRLNRTS
jgi:crotonobetainyl-CoA:carnitine CoA-transferase CaiB-like acyl-CoA transferase